MPNCSEVLGVAEPRGAQCVTVSSVSSGITRGEPHFVPKVRRPLQSSRGR
jgi:hypothetical protein